MSSFQELDEQDFPVTRLDLEIQAQKRREAADIDAAEKMRRQIKESRTRPKYKRIDTSTDLQTLDIGKFPVQPTGAPPPPILRRIGSKVGHFETAIARAPTALRSTDIELRFTEIVLQETGQHVRIPKVRRPSGAKKIDVAADIQALDIEKFPLSRPRGLETPQGISRLGGLTLRAGAGFYDALTMPLRPTLIGETVKTGVGVIFSHKIRGEIGAAIARDPAGFTAELAGGYLGGRLLGKGIGKIKSAYTKHKYATDLPDEAFYHPEEFRGTDFPEPYQEVATFKGYKPLKVAIKDKAGYEYVSIGPDDFLGIADDTPRGTLIPDVDPPPVRWKPIGGRLTIDIDQSVKGSGSAIDDLYRSTFDEAAFYKIGKDFGAVKTKGLIQKPMKPLITEKPIVTGIGAQKLTSFARNIGERGFTQRKNIWGIMETRYIPRTRSTLFSGWKPPTHTLTTIPFSAVGILTGLTPKVAPAIPSIRTTLIQKTTPSTWIGESTLPIISEKTIKEELPKLKQDIVPIQRGYPQYGFRFRGRPRFLPRQWPSQTPVPIFDVDQRQRQRPIPIFLQTLRSGQTYPPPPIPPIFKPPRPPPEPRKTLLPIEEKKKKKKTDAYARLFAGQWRRYRLHDPRRILEI